MTAKINPKRILFLAQLPPPFHGQSVVSGAVHNIFAKQAKADVHHLWSGGAASATDVGKRSMAKYLGFAKMVAKLTGLFMRGKRFDVAYLGVAPWAHTLGRDAILIGLAKLVSQRVWLHVHGQGLEKIIQPQTLTQRIYRKIFSNTELLAITGDIVNLGKTAGIFHRVNHIRNFSEDPGPLNKRQNKSIHLGTLCNLDPRKGVFEFLACLSRLNEKGHPVHGTIIGGPTAALSVGSLRRHVEERGLKDCVTITGSVDEDEKKRLLGQIDVFLYPSRHDLAPLALIEAMAHSCVPIVFETGGIPEIVGPELENNVLPTTLGKDAFCKRACALVETYLADRKKFNNDSKCARAQFLARYSQAGFSGNVLALLAQDFATSNNNRPPAPAIVEENLS